MATKKSGPTLAAWNAQIAVLQAQADALRKNEVAEVVAKIKDAIAHYGLTAADLGLATGARKNARLLEADSDKPAGERRKKAEPKPSARAVKFKDDQGNTWGGMGKRPAWFKAALASGKTPDELLAKYVFTGYRDAASRNSKPTVMDALHAGADVHQPVGTAASVRGSKLGDVVLARDAKTAACMNFHRSTPWRRQVS